MWPFIMNTSEFIDKELDQHSSNDRFYAHASNDISQCYLDNKVNKFFKFLIKVKINSKIGR